MYNTIILKVGEAKLTKAEFDKFSEGDTIFGTDSNPTELQRWKIAEENEAKAQLTKHCCEYNKGIELYYITEYALEYCECDEDGEFVQGSDFDLAEKKITKFEIYCNYGVLAAEKRKVYTYGNKSETSVTSDKLSVELPENEYFSLHETEYGRLFVKAAWGWDYDINEVLIGNEKPYFHALDTNMKAHNVYLDVLD